jgi:acyl-CoA synthetase (AMP-forming)/AMP-acid ligase II
MNLASIIEGHPDDAVALISQGRSLGYGELRAKVGALRGALARSGVAEGDRVALLCGNDPHFVIALLATVGLGAVVVPLNPTSPAPEIERQLSEAEPSALVVGPTAAEAWEGVHPSVTGRVGTVIATAGHDVDGALTFDALLDGEPVQPTDLPDDTLAALMFTSGTAGASLAAMLSHGNILANLRQIRSAGEGRLVAEDVVFSVLPLHHVMGLAILLLTLGSAPGPCSSSASTRSRRSTRSRAARSPWCRARRRCGSSGHSSPTRCWPRCGACGWRRRARPRCRSRWRSTCRPAAASRSARATG